MIFEDFKNLCSQKKKGDLKLPDTNEKYKPLIQESLEYIAKNCIPIHLISDDLTQEDLRFINIKQIIRMPKAPIEDADKIDIDETLVYAVAYDLLANRTADLSKAAFYTQKRDEELNSYKWNNYKVIEEIKNEY